MRASELLKNVQHAGQSFIEHYLYRAHIPMLEVLPASVMSDLKVLDGGVSVKTIREISTRHFVDTSIYLALKFLHTRPADQATYLEAVSKAHFGPPELFMMSFKRAQQNALVGIADGTFEFASNVGLAYLMGPAHFNARWKDLVDSVYSSPHTIPCFIGYSSFSGFLPLVESMPAGASALLVMCPREGGPNYGLVVEKSERRIQVRFFDEIHSSAVDHLGKVVLIDDTMSSGKTMIRIGEYLARHFLNLQVVGEKCFART